MFYFCFPTFYHSCQSFLRRQPFVIAFHTISCSQNIQNLYSLVLKKVQKHQSSTCVPIQKILGRLKILDIKARFYLLTRISNLSLNCKCHVLPSNSIPHILMHTFKDIQIICGFVLYSSTLTCPWQMWIFSNVDFFKRGFFSNVDFFKSGSFQMGIF